MPFTTETAGPAAARGHKPSGRLKRLLRTVDGDVDAWAERTAASLPPLTETEAAALGKLAAKLDERRASRKEAA